MNKYFTYFSGKWSPAITIPLVYAIFASVWLLFSDRVLAMWVDDVNEVQVLKDWTKLAITTIFLFLLVTYYFSRLQSARLSLRESERRLTTLVNNLPGVVYRCLNDSQYTMLFVGGGCRELTGFPASAFIKNRQLSFADIIHPEDRQNVWNEASKHAMLQKPFELLYRIRTADGSIKWIKEYSQGVLNSEGKFLYFEGFLTDVTRQRENEQALSYQGNFLRNIIDNIPFPLFYKDLEGRYLGCNQHFCTYLNREYDEIIGKTAHDLFALPQAQHYESKDMELLQTGQPQKYESRIVFPDGRSMETVFHKSLFLDPQGNPGGILGVYYDISERVAAENTIRKQVGELERINKELERFTYTVSHDLRSPLVTIKGFLGMLREDMEEGDHEQVEMDIQRISKAADKMHFLLEDLLQLSRIGRVSNPFIWFDMSKAAEEVVEHLDGIIRETNTSISVQPNMPQVYGDRTRVMEVYQNLIENAVKFREPSRPLQIEIGCHVNEPESVFYVKDNGQGIETPFQKKIFDLFNKLDPRTSGTGIGLALVHRIVEFHGGKVWVESGGKDQGALFCFTLNSNS